MSEVLKMSHVKDPQNYLYLATDPHVKICCSREQIFTPWNVKNVCSERTCIQRFAPHSKTAKVVDLLFFNRESITRCLKHQNRFPS